MKNIIKLFLIFASLSISLYSVQAQKYYQGSVKVDLTSSGPYIVFSVKLTAPANENDGFSGIEFFLVYPNTNTLTFGSPVNNTTDFPTLSMTYGGQNTTGILTGKTTEWWWWASGGGTGLTTYVVGQEYEVFRVPVSSSTADFGDISLEFDGQYYYTYFVFTDEIGTGWTAYDQYVDAPIYYGPGTYDGGNGDDVFDGGSCSYTEYDKPLVPMVLYQNATWAGGTGTGNQPGASDGSKKCYIRDANAPLTQANAFVNDLIIQTSQSLIINPGASLTANGPTTITSTYGLQLWADNTGVGSFIDNGTINYGTGAFAYIETHLSNSGTYYFHQVGPTVDNLPSGSGVTLADFDLSTSNTYAYEWDEPTQLWVNQFSETYPVNTGSGLLLTTNNGSAGDVAQKGSIINTNVSLNLVLSGDPTDVNNSYGWNLKSNPYSAALDWDDAWTREYTTSNDLNPTVYVLDNGNNTYASYNANSDVGTGMTKDIQIGQGFWTQYDQNPYVAPGNVSFTLQPSDRNHSTAAFLKEGKVDQLTLTVSGNNSADVLAIAFRENGSFTYDRFLDVDKWQSFFEEATEIWTMSNDMKDLTHNILPTLGNSNVSVPMAFECHAAGEYTITASDIESFQGNVEIYLEDLVTGAEWHDLVTNPVYTFDAGEAGVAERFVVHFFGTTGIDDPDAYSPVIIYAWGQDAYIVNRGSETVKEYVAYDMMGRELHRGTLPNTTVNKVQIGDVSAYYVVKVITKEGRIYTDKVYINK